MSNVEMRPEWPLVTASIFSVFGAKGAVGVIAVLMLNFSKAMPMPVEKRIGFGTAFQSPWFAAARTIRHQVGGKHREEFFGQLMPLTLGVRLQECFTITARSRKAPGKADPLQGDAMTASTFEHEPAHQIMH